MMEDNSYKRTVYHPREPEASPLWKLLNNHYEGFEQCYEERFEEKYGFFRPVIGGVIRQYLTCGDLKNGFARVRCRDCRDEYLLAFSCKGRWFCPSCHAKKVVQFGESLRDNSSTQSPIGNMSSLFPLGAVSTLSMTGAYLQGYATVFMRACSFFYETQ